MIRSAAEFAAYFDGVRRRTVGFVRCVPAAEVDWAPKTGEFTCGDIIRHIAASEIMFAGAAVDGRWRYRGHDRRFGATLEEALADLDRCHGEARSLLARVTDADLFAPRPQLEGDGTVKAWRLLMAMVEHEVHHRSQLASYLTLLSVEAPDIFGLGVEDVARLGAAGRQA
jgi:uncharacterized damage-inducible protein DinB